MKPALNTLQVEWWPIARPQPYPHNARKLSSRAVETVALSLKTFGWRQPIVVDKKDVIVVGHTRLLAAQSLGMTQVPVHVAHELTAAQIRAYRIMDNRAADETEWDEPTLATELAELAALETDLATTGFDQTEIGDMLQGEPLVDEDAVIEPPDASTARLGDVWLLGEHRVLCGDCCDPKAVAALLGDRKPLLMVTDPPYGVELDSEWRDRAGLNGKPATETRARTKDGCPAEPSYMKRSAGHTQTKISGDTRADWSEAFGLVPSLQVAYVWHSSRYTHEVLDGLLRCGFVHHEEIIWVKNHAVLTRTLYWYQHEPCWFVRKKNAPWYGKPGAGNTTIWNAISPKMIMGGSEEQRFDHPTQKPVALMTKPIANHTKRGALVYEPFLGSGTTLAAAQITGRVCCGIELDPKYVDVVVLRWQAMSGETATLEGDGRTFAAVAAARAKSAKKAA